MDSTERQADIAVAEKVEIREPSQYNVIVHNNDDTSYDEVVYIVSKGFEFSEHEAYDIAKTVDTAGRGICGTYSKEIAETKIMFTEMIKESLIAILPYRARQIKLLKFTMEKA